MRMRAEGWRGLIGCFFAVAMVAAPFLALLYGFTEGLLVMVGALAATAYLAWDTTHTVPPNLRRRLTIVAVVNALLSAAGVAVLLIRLV